MDKEVLSSTKDGEIRELLVLSDPSNDNSTKINQRIKILAHPKNLMEVLRARVAIEKGLIGNAINNGPNGFCFTRSFLDGEALRIFELKAQELGHQTAGNLKLAFNHVVYYFAPKECLSKHKRYMRYRITKPRDMSTRQYVGFVRDLNGRLAQMPPNFDTAQVLEETELVDFLADKAPKSHKVVRFAVSGSKP